MNDGTVRYGATLDLMPLADLLTSMIYATTRAFYALGDDPAVAVAAASAIVASAALLLGIVEWRASRRRQRLMIRPKLQVTTETGGGPAIAITNVGLGPAEIREVALLLDSKEIGSALSFVEVDAWVEEMDISPPPPVVTSVYMIHQGASIPAGRSMELVGMHGEKNQINAFAVARGLSRAGLRIEFDSLHGERFSYVEESLLPMRERDSAGIEPAGA